MTKAVNAADYYNANAKDEKTYARMWVQMDPDKIETPDFLKDVFLNVTVKSQMEPYNGENAHKGKLVRGPEPDMTGIILDQEVTFAFKAGNYTAAKGSFLFVNPKDEDGYTVLPASSAKSLMEIGAQEAAPTAKKNNAPGSKR